MKFLVEDSRKDYISKGKTADKYAPSNQHLGLRRYNRRTHSKVARSVAQFNKISMDELFKFDILRVDIEVQGETDKYLVTLAMPGVIEYLRNNLKDDDRLDSKTVYRAVMSAFNSDDIRVHCTCPDFKYRFAYWLTKKNLNAGEPQTDPGKGIANPHDSKGTGCKHIMLVLSNNSWVIKVASVIRNYINYMSKHEERLYKEIIYPAIHGHEYKEDDGIQQELTPNDNGDIIIDKSTALNADETALDAANKWAKTKNQFKKGNQSGIQFTNKRSDGQLEFTKDSPKLFDYDSVISDK